VAADPDGAVETGERAADHGPATDRSATLAPTSARLRSKLGAPARLTPDAARIFARTQRRDIRTGPLGCGFKFALRRLRLGGFPVPVFKGPASSADPIEPVDPSRSIASVTIAGRSGARGVGRMDARQAR